MAKEDNSEGRLVYHTAGSRLDLISIYQYNEVIYGEDHAERYLDFLDSQITRLAQNPVIGRKVEQHPEVRVHLAKLAAAAPLTATEFSIGKFRTG
jgi:plasmid stabilization system protein ParE